MILFLLMVLGAACGFVLWLAVVALGAAGDVAALLAGVVGTTVAYQIVGWLARDHQ